MSAFKTMFSDGGVGRLSKMTLRSITNSSVFICAYFQHTSGGTDVRSKVTPWTIEEVYNARFQQRRKAIFKFKKAGNSEWVSKNKFKIYIWKNLVKFSIEGRYKLVGNIAHERKQGKMLQFRYVSSMGCRVIYSLEENG